MAKNLGFSTHDNAKLKIGKARFKNIVEGDGDNTGQNSSFQMKDNSKVHMKRLKQDNIISAKKPKLDVCEDGKESFTNAFKQVVGVQSDLPAYKLTGKCGVLILCNIFRYDRNKYRNGAIEDIKAMKDLFEKLGCDVESHKEVFARDLDTIITDFKNKLKETGCGSCIIIIMSHSGKSANSILMEDQKEKNLYRDFVYKFSHESFPEFKEKPKIFLVQACQKFGDDELEDSLSGDDNIEDDEKQSGGDLGKVTIEDVLVCFSTIPYQPALRSAEGSFFIQAIKEEFRDHANKRRTLRRMLYEVHGLVSKKCQKYNNDQVEEKNKIITQSVSSLESGFKTYIFNNFP